MKHLSLILLFLIPTAVAVSDMIIHEPGKAPRIVTTPPRLEPDSKAVILQGKFLGEEKPVLWVIVKQKRAPGSASSEPGKITTGRWGPSFAKPYTNHERAIEALEKLKENPDARTTTLGTRERNFFKKNYPNHQIKTLFK